MSEQSPVHALDQDTPWEPSSWQHAVALQQPAYDDAAELQNALTSLASLPPLVTSWEVMALKQLLADAQQGRRFLLQGGDCAENFGDCNDSVITNRLKVLLQMSLVLVHGLKLPVLRVGRFAGQYAKPRSSDTETRDGTSLPCYRGDIVNSPEFNPQARRPDPARMIQAHARSAMTMNFVRALIDGGFADLRHPEYWNLRWVEHSPLAAEYRQMVDGIGNSLKFMETLAGESLDGFSRVDFYTSHEALLLHYEQAQTRQVPRQWGWFNLSTHLPWIGMRTAALDGAHVEYFRGIRNPVAIKVGPTMDRDHLLRLLDVLNPREEAGRITLIHRMGSEKIGEHLPGLLKSVQEAGRTVLWVCDPMHGNTEKTGNGFKTRRFDRIASELARAFDIHEAAGTRLGGVHLELTGEDVTECTGGARGLADGDLERAYKSHVDPRLNYEQSLELAMMIVRKMGKDQGPAQSRGG